ncbi:MAG: hypothetical protein QME05_05040 [Candidatus Margulisbacteria bacterium]|nr:hypothetical protein [Candidatus Margulisiibacteriota bacterium]
MEREIRPGVWIGRGVRANQATLNALRPPVIIGNFVTLEEGAIVGPNVVIGQDWIIQSGAKVSGSLLLPPFYEDRLDAFKVVHPGTEIRECIIAGGEINRGQTHEKKIIVVAPNGELAVSALEM